MNSSLTAAFERARNHKAFRDHYTLKLQDVAKLFELMDGKFNHKPNYWPSVFTPLNGNFWNIRGHTLAYFTDLKQKVYLKGDPLDEKFNPETAHTYPASPGILYSEHYKRFKKKTFGLIIQQRIPLDHRGLHDRKLLDKHPPAFGLEGIRTDIDADMDIFAIHKLILPVFEGNTPVDAVAKDAASMGAEEIERALLYGRLCTFELLTKRTLSVKRNWDMAQNFDLKGFPAPWKRPATPVAIPN